MENELFNNLSYIEILFIIVSLGCCLLGCCLFGWKIMFYRKKAKLAIALLFHKEAVSEDIKAEFSKILIGKDK